MSEAELRHKCTVAKMIFEDYITYFDWFTNFNQLINPEAKEEQLIFSLQGQLHGIEVLFTLGSIENKKHQSLLEDILYSLTAQTKSQGLTVAQRADLICNEFKTALLNLAE